MDCGLAENFGADSGLFIPGSSDRSYQNEVWITLVGLRRYWYENIIYRSLQDLVVKLYHTNFSSNAGSDLSENSGGLTDLAKKWHGSADLRTPIRPPLLSQYTYQYMGLSLVMRGT